MSRNLERSNYLRVCIASPLYFADGAVLIISLVLKFTVRKALLIIKAEVLI